MKTTQPATVSLRTSRKNRKSPASGLRRGFLATSAAALLAVVASAPSSHALPLTWDIVPGAPGAGDGAITGGGGIWDLVNGSWTADGGANNINWTNGNDAIFSGAGGIVTLGGPISANSVALNAGGYTLQGATTLTLTGGPAALSSTAGGFIGSNVTIATVAGTITNNAGTLTLTNLVNAGNLGLTVAGAGDTSFFNPITNTTTLTKNGAGTLTLSGNNGFTTAQINGGTIAGLTLTLSGGGAATLQSTATSVVNPPNLVFTNAGGSTIDSTAGTLTLGTTLNASNFALSFTGAGNTTLLGNMLASASTLTKSGAGTLTLAGNNIFSTAQINGGTITGGGSTLTLTSGGVVLTSTATSAVNSNLTLSNLGGAQVNSNAGTLTLGGTVTTTGGGLTFGGGGAMSFTGTLNANGQALTFTSGGGSATLSNAITNGTTLNMNSTGPLTLAGANVFTTGLNYNNTGAILGAGATLNVGGASAIISIAPGASITPGIVATAAGTTITTNSNTLTLNGGINAQNNSLIFTGAGNTTVQTTGITNGTTLTKNGGGVLTLSTANTLTGGVTLNSGTLNINNAGALGAGAFTINGGTIDASAGAIVNAGNNALNLNGDFSFTGTNNLNLGNGAVSVGGSGPIRNINLNGSTLTIGGNITFAGSATTLMSSNPGDLTIRGTVTGNFIVGGNGMVIAGTVNSFGSGTTMTIFGGALELNGNSITLGSLSGFTGVLRNTVGGAVTLTLAGTNVAPVTFSGPIQDIPATPISLTKTGAGQQNLTAANFYRGTTTISGGTLSVSVLANGGTASGIGLSSNAAANLVLDGGTFAYTGGAQSTDRLFTVTSNGGTILSNGSGALNFTNTGLLAMPGAGNRTLTLSGTFAGGVNVLAAQINDPAGFTTTVNIPAGVSKWLLTNNANSFGGAITVAAGNTLIVGANGALGGGGSAANGTTVQAGGTLQLQNGVNMGNEFLTINGDGAPGSGGALILQPGAGNAASWAGPITAASNSTINANGGMLTFTGGLVKTDVNLTLTDSLNSAKGVATINFNGAITGNGTAFNDDLFVTGVTTNLNAANTYLGPTHISSTATGGGLGGGNGVLNANVANALPTLNGRTAVDMDQSGVGGSTLNIAGIPLPGANQAIASLVGAVNSLVVLGDNNLRIGFGTAPNTNGTANAVFAGVITGGAGGLGGLIKDDTSTQILTGSNTYVGQTRVNGGTLQIGDGVTAGASIGASAPVIVDAAGTLAVNLVNGGTFTNNVNDNNGTVRGINTVGNTQTFSGQLSGTGQFIQSGAGTSIFTNINGYQGGTRVSGGTLQVGTAGQASSVGNGAVRLDGNGTFTLVNVNGGILSNSIDANLAASNGLVNVNTAGSVELAGALTNSGGGGATLTLTKNGIGTAILTNAGNTYSGSTTVNAGKLQIGKAGVAGSLGAAAIGVNSGATFSLVNVNGNALANNISATGSTGTVEVDSANTNTLSGALTNGGGTLALVQKGAGTTILTNAVGNTFTGGVTVSAGVLQIGNAGNAGSIGGAFGDGSNGTTINVGTGGTLSIVNMGGGSGFSSGPYSGPSMGINVDPVNIVNNLGGTGTVLFNTTATVRIIGGIKDGTGILAVTKNNTGVGFLRDNVSTGPSTYSGVTNVNTGTLVILGGTALGSAAGGTVVASLATLDIFGSAVVGEHLTISGTGDAGNGQIAALTNRGSAAASWGGDVTLAGATTIGSDVGNDITIGGSIGGGAQNLTKSGTAKLILNGASTYSGTTTVAAGELRVNGSLANTAVTVQSGATLSGTGTIAGPVSILAGGTLAAGNSPGTLTVGSLSLVVGSNTAFELGVPGVIGQASLPGNDLIQVNGNLTLAGNLNVTPIAGFGAGSYRLFNYTGSLTNNVPLVNGVPAGLSPQLVTSVANQVNLVVLNSAAVGISQYWDGPHTNSTNVEGGNGTWDGFQNNWTDAAGTAVASWQNGVAIFMGAPGTVTLASTVNAQGLMFGTSGYQINGSGAFTLNLVGPTPAPTITVSPGIVATINAQITGSLGFTADGAGTLFLTNAGNSYQGGTTITNGTVSVAADGALGNVASGITLNSTVIGGSTPTLQVTGTFSTSRSITLTGTGRIDVTGINTFSANDVVGGTGALSKLGTGTLVLTNTNTYTGPTNILDGTVSVFSNDNLGNAAGGITFGGSAGSNAILKTAAGINFGTRAVTLNTGGGTVDTNGFDSTLAGAITGGALNSLKKVGAGTLILTNALGNTYTGVTTISAGTLQVGDAGNAGSIGGFNGSGTTINVGTGGTLSIVNMGGSVSFSAPPYSGKLFQAHIVNNLGGGGTVLVNSAATVGLLGNIQDGTGTIAFSKNGTGVAVLGGGNTYSGLASVNLGTLVLLTPTALGSTLGGTNVASGATLDIFGQSVAGENLTISGTGDAGNGQNAALTNRSGVAASWGGNVTLAGATTIGSDVGNDITIGGSIGGGAQNLTKSGTGRLILTGASSYNGTTTVGAGTLLVNGSLGNTAVTVQNTGTLGGTGSIGGSVTVNTGGNLSPGTSPGTLTVGPLTLNAGSNSNFELRVPGTIGSGVNDLVNVNGNLTIDAGALLNITPLAAPAPGFTSGSYRLFNYTGSLSFAVGAFANNPFGLNPANFSPIVDTSITGQVNLVVLPVGAGPIQYWDGAGPFGNGVVNGGSSTWSNFGNTNWTDVTGNPVQAWQNGMAVFAGTAGIATLTETVYAQSLKFETTGYSINSSGGAALNLMDATPAQPTINVVGGIATINAQIIGTQGFNANGTGTLFLTNTGNSFTGGILVTNGGTVSVAADGALGGAGSGVTLNNGTLQTTATFTLAAARTLTMGAGNGTIEVTGPDTLTIGGLNQITGAGALRKTGTGTLNLTNANNYLGGTFISGGTLQVNNDNNLGNVAGGIIFANNALLKTMAGITSSRGITLNAGGGTIDTNGFNSTLNGLIIDGAPVAQPFTKAGAGTLLVTNANPYTGQTNITGGTLQVGDGTSALTKIGNNTGNVVISSLATLGVNLANGGILANNIDVAVAGAISANNTVGKTQTLSGLLSGAGTLNQDGTGVTVVSGNNVGFNGPTNVNFGTIVLANANALGATGVAQGTSVTSGASLDLNGQAIVGEPLQLAGTGDAGNSRIAALTNTGGVPASWGGSVTLAGPTTIGSNGAGVNDITIGGSIGGGAQALTKNGTARLILTGNSTYTGPTNVTAGELRVNGSLANTAVTVQSGAILSGTGTLAGSVTILNGGILNPGTSPGTITVGSLVLNSSSTTNFELATPGVVGGPTNDLVNVTGNLTLDGNINVIHPNNAAPGFLSGSYRLFNYGGVLTVSNLPSTGAGTLTLNGSTTTWTDGNFTNVTPLVITSVAGQVNLVVLPNGVGPIQYWDGTDAPNNNFVGGGNGTWQNFATNWTNGAGLPFPPTPAGIGSANLGWQNGIAVFGGTTPPVNATIPAGQVILGDAVFAQGLVFGTSGYEILGLGTNTLNLVYAGNPVVDPFINVVGGVATISAQITGNQGLWANGTGTLFLNNVTNNFFNAATPAAGLKVTNGGTVSVTNDAPLGAVTAGITLNNGTLQANGTFTLTSTRTVTLGAIAGDTGTIEVTGANTLNIGGANQLTGNGALVKTGTGILNLTAANNYAGGTFISGGTLQVNNDNNLGNLSGGITFANNAVLKTTAGITSNRNITLNAGGGTFDSNGFNSTLTGMIADGTGFANFAQPFTKAGLGTLLVTNNNTYNGQTNVAGGTLQVGDGTTFARIGNNSANVVVSTGATLGVNLVNGGFMLNPISVAAAGTISANNTVGNFQTIVGVISGAGALNQDGTGITILSGNNAAFTGLTSVNFGTFRLAHANALGTSGLGQGTVVASGATLDLFGQDIIGEPVQIAGAGDAGNGYIGVLANHAVATPASLGGGITLSASASIGNDLTVGGDFTLSGSITGGAPANLTKVGTNMVTFSAINSYLGYTTVAAGILVAGDSIALGSVNAGTTVNNGASLMIGNGISTTAEPLIIVGAGSAVRLGILNISGALTQQLNGSSNYNGVITVDPTNIVGGATISTNGTGTMNINAGIVKNGVVLTLKGGGIININNVAISGATSFTSDLVVDGTGFGGATVVNANVANSYAGPTYITNGGTFNAKVPGALPSTAADGLGGIASVRTTVIMDPTAQITNSSAPFPSTGSSILNLSASQAIQALIGPNNTSQVNLGTNTLIIGTSAVVAPTTSPATFAGIISGANAAGASIIKDGTSTQIFSGLNSYTGTTTVSGGTLQAGVANNGGVAGPTAIGTNGAFGNNSAVTVGAAGTLDIAGFNVAIGSLSGAAGGLVQSTGGAATLTTGGLNTSTTFAGVLQNGAGGTFSLWKVGTGTQILSGINTYTGTTIVGPNGGTLQAGSTQAFGVNSPTTVNTNSILELAGFSNTIGSLSDGGNGANSFVQNTLNGAATLTLAGTNGAPVTYDGVIRDTSSTVLTLIKNGAGTQTISGVNTYRGSTTINGGILSLADGFAILDPSLALPTGGAVIVNAGGTLNLATSETIGTLTGAVGSFVTLNANTLTLGVAGVAGGNTTFAGIISGVGGNIVKNSADTQTFSGANTYTGTTTVNGGILRAANATALGTTAVGTTVANAASLQIANGTAVVAEPLTINGAGFGGIGALTQDAGGSSSFAGPITVATNSTIGSNGAGTLTLGGTIDKTDVNLTLIGGGTININGSITGNTTGFNDDLIVDGVTTNLNSANTYLGPTFIRNNGTLNANTANALPTANGRTSITIDGAGASSLVLNNTGQAIASLQSALTTSSVNLNGNILTIGFGAAPNTNGTANANFAGVISGAGGIIKDGTSTQIFSGANIYTGGTTLTSGVLGAGNLKAFGSGNLTVNGGTLVTVGGPRIVNLGGGNIAINGGTAVFQIGGTTPGTQHDQIVTAGGFGPLGGTLALTQLNAYQLAPGDKVNLVSALSGVAGGSVNGTAVPGANVTGLSAFSNTPLLIPTVNLYNTTVTLEAMQGLFANVFTDFTPNQLAVANALDSLQTITGGHTGIFSELNFLDTQSISTLKGNLDKIAPEEFGAFFDISKSLSRTQNRNIMTRTEDIRNQAAAGGGGGTGSGGVAFRTGASSVQGGYSSGPSGKESKEIVPASIDRWGLWMIGSGEFTRVGSTTNAAGYRYETGGVTAGLDYRFTDHFTLGLSLGYMGTNTTLANGGSLDVDGGRVGLYATYYDGGFYVDAAVNGGLNSYKTRRVTPNNTTASASPDGSEVNVLFATGYDWKVGSMKIGPTFSYQYTSTDVDGFTETGAFAPLRVRSSSSESSRTAVGMRVSWDTEVAGKRVRPELRAAWQHEFGDNSHQFTSNFATLGGSAFTVTSPVTGRDSALVGAGITVLWNESTAIYLNYDGEIGRKNYESHSVSGGLRLQF